MRQWFKTLCHGKSVFIRDFPVNVSGSLYPSDQPAFVFLDLSQFISEYLVGIFAKYIPDVYIRPPFSFCNLHYTNGKWNAILNLKERSEWGIKHSRQPVA
jgi:hypothetical protein